MRPANGGQAPAGVAAEGLDRLPNELACLLQVLDAEYGYNLDHFVRRANVISLPLATGEPGLNALSLYVPPGFPFLLAVASTEAQRAAHREAAIRHALDTTTINAILLHDGASDYREILRRDFREDRFEAASGLRPYSAPGSNGQLSLLADDAANEGVRPSCRSPTSSRTSSSRCTASCATKMVSMLTKHLRNCANCFTSRHLLNRAMHPLAQPRCGVWKRRARCCVDSTHDPSIRTHRSRQ